MNARRHTKLVTRLLRSPLGLGLLLGSLNVHAALEVGNPQTESVAAGHTPELVLVIWDPVKEVSYMKDLGTRVYSANYAAGDTATNLFVYGQQDAGYQKLFSPLNTDASFTNFLAKSTDKANQIWAVFALNVDPDLPLSENGSQVYTTLNTQFTAGTENPAYTAARLWSNGEMSGTAANSSEAGVGPFNLLKGACITDACKTDYASNSSLFSVKTDAAYVGNFLNANGTFAASTASPNIFNPVNKSSWFYTLSSSNDDGVATVAIDEFDNLGHDAYWGLGVAENGDYILSYTLEAALTQATTVQGQLLRLRTDFAASYGSTRLIGAPIGDSLILGVDANTVTAVPEPSTWGLMGLGLALLAGRARRLKSV